MSRIYKDVIVVDEILGFDGLIGFYKPYIQCPDQTNELITIMPSHEELCV